MGLIDVIKGYDEINQAFVPATLTHERTFSLGRLQATKQPRAMELINHSNNHHSNLTGDWRAYLQNLGYRFIQKDEGGYEIWRKDLLFALYCPPERLYFNMSQQTCLDLWGLLAATNSPEID